jgi:DNA-binding transcriptional MerR regulator
MLMKLFRVSETARELGISEAWLRRAEKSGRIPKARRDLNKWRVYSQEELELIRTLLLPTEQNK